MDWTFYKKTNVELDSLLDLSKFIDLCRIAKFQHCRGGFHPNNKKIAKTALPFTCSLQEDEPSNLHAQLSLSSINQSINQSIMTSMYSKPVSPHDLAKQDPGPTDVICARGKRALEHIGNKRYKGLITKHLQVYSDAKTKLDKSLIVNHIIDAVRNASPQGNFIREENGVWVEVGDAVAREKIGQRYASRFLLDDGGSSVDEHHMLTLLVVPCSCLLSTVSTQQRSQT